MSQNKKCKNCGNPFTITDQDLAFYDKISPIFVGKKYVIPSPTYCPDCRQQRRLSFRNERNFYIRESDQSGKKMVSAYSPDKEMIVRDAKEWRSDSYDGTKYGRDFDFTKSFFVQYDLLSRQTPRPALMNMKSENSDYTNHAVYNKNCYMCMDAGYNENLMYCSHFCIYNKNCIDCLYIQYCENSYFCTDTIKSVGCSYLFQCKECYQCHFCYDCIGCNHCFSCSNLKSKNYCISNQQYTKEEYEQKIKEIFPSDKQTYNTMVHKRKEGIQQIAIHRNLDIEQSEEVSGDHLLNCQNTYDSYMAFAMKDCKFCYDAGEMKDCYDISEPYQGEREYEIHACNINYNMLFTSKCFENKNLIYCQYCWFCDHCFGCFGLRNKEYCIFNKQYTKEAYEIEVGKIITYMQEILEWGEFFPINISGFTYNETLAQEYYSLSQEEVIERGWKRYNEQHDIKGLTSDDPNVKICEVSGRPFKLLPQEIKFYEKHNLPSPTKHPDVRHMERMNLRNPRELRKTKCDKCSKVIQTTYRQGILNIYCKECYNKEIYG